MCRALELEQPQLSWLGTSRNTMRVQVCTDAATALTLPHEVASGQAAWLPDIATLFDAHALAAHACKLHASIAPSVEIPKAAPEALSYFLASVSGLLAEDQHVLFCAPNTVMRLQMVRTCQHAAVCFFALSMIRAVTGSIR